MAFGAFTVNKTNSAFLMPTTGRMNLRPNRASRGATAAEVQNTNKELNWILTDDNQKHLRAFLHWLIQMEKANGSTLQALEDTDSLNKP